MKHLAFSLVPGLIVLLGEILAVAACPISSSFNANLAATATGLNTGAPTAGRVNTTEGCINGIDVTSLTAGSVATNVMLAAKETTDAPNGVWRNDYSAGFGATPLFFTPQTGTCASHSMTNDGGSCVDTTGGNSWKAVHHSNGIDPIQFGAPIDNTGDASVGINAAIAVIRAQGTRDSHFSSALDLGGSSRIYRITNTINMTCLSDRSGTDGCAIFNDSGVFPFKASGAQILCFTSGHPCIDALGSEFVNIDGPLYISGDCGRFTPNFGLQFGRTKRNAGAGYWSIRDLYTQNCFTRAGVYDGGAEQTEIISALWLNLQGSGTSYGAIFDGDNHWNVTSQFVTNALTVDSPNSFNDTHIWGGTIGAAGPPSTSNAVWLSGTNRLSFEKTFLRSNGSPTDCITIWNDGVSVASFPHMMQAHFHCETDGTVAHTFNISSKNAFSIVRLDALDYKEFDSIARTSVFAKDANTVGVQLLDESMHIINYGTAPTLFDTASAYTISDPSHDYLFGINGWAPTWSCTGLGTAGSCALRYGTPAAGVVRLTTGTGSVAGFGNLSPNFGFNMGLHTAMCFFVMITPGDSGFWNAPGANVYAQGYSTVTPLFQWQNGALSALATSSHVDIAYTCRGM